jgi:beta-galactosidase/beta-glucuronidase
VYVPESLNRAANSIEDGVLIQTLTSEHQKTQQQRYATKAAQASLATALTKYQGSLIQNLDRGWKFTTDPDKRGVEQGFFKPEFNDKTWAPISAIGPWQSQGFEKYHGTAWYRKTFTLSAADIDPTWLGGKKILLFVGAVDGDAVFYLNGQKIGERRQADYVDSWMVPFVLDATSATIVGNNTLVVQVTKDFKAAGLYKGVSLIAGVSEKQ